MELLWLFQAKYMARPLKWGQRRVCWFSTCSGVDDLTWSIQSLALWRRFIHIPLFALYIVLNVSFEVCFSSPPSWECLCLEECHSNAVSSGQPLQRSSFYTITCDICRRTHKYVSSYISGTEEPWNAHWRKRTKSDPVTIFDNKIRLVTISIIRDAPLCSF